MEELKFETEVCSRCAGTGEHSYCQSYGTRCFKCLGSGKALTKRGAEAKRYCIKLCSKKAKDIKVGERISSGGYKGKVLEVTRIIQKGASLKDGVMVPFETPSIVFKLKNISIQVYEESEIFVVPENDENLKKALEYQNTLTKQGKVRKTAKKVV